MPRKKLLVLSSYGGFGHIAAAATLEHILEKDYELNVIYPIKDLRIFGMPQGEAWYNFMIARNHLNRLTNWTIKKLSFPIFARRTEKTCRLIQRHIEEKNPDLVISLIPFVNHPAAEAAKRCRVPFLLVTTDNDLEHWVFDMEKIDYSRLAVTIGDDLPTTKGSLLRHRIQKEQVHTLGLPLRTQFEKKQNKEELRARYQIPEGKPVLMIMMGGIGSRGAIRYTKLVAKHLSGLHLIVCTGKKQKLAEAVRACDPGEGNSIQVIPFTEKIHELFALADLLITKPGPGTLNEAFSQRLPVLIDRTYSPVFWEEVNIELILSKKVGSYIPSFKKAPEIIRQFLFDEQIREEIERAYATFPPSRFSSKIKALVDDLCPEPLTGEVVMTSKNITL